MSAPLKTATVKQPVVPGTTPVSKKVQERTESPGNWRHPRLSEISRRKRTSTFSEGNIRKIAFNLVILLTLWTASLLLHRYTPVSRWASAQVKAYMGYAYTALQTIPLVNIGVACWPLFQKPDDFSDIPLTPGQRKLLGLPPSSTPSSPKAGYSTPPRYSRTPSISGSIGSRNAYSGSPLSGRGSPAPVGTSSPASYSPIPASPLLQKAMGGPGHRRSSLSSPNPLGAGNSSSLFADSPSPSPGGMGKRSSVSLNNKWLYERGRRSSNQNWYS